jgi:EpsI family protein
MLSLAYGANQSRALQLHKPEVCYTAQGFRVHSLAKAEIVVDGAALSVMHLVGQQGARVEPITYWMRIGDDVARGWYEQNRTRLKYGLRGLIPDGLLFRVSSLSTDLPAEYAAQQAFVADLLRSVNPAQRRVLVGNG